jgi:MFS family permease
MWFAGCMCHIVSMVASGLAVSAVFLICARAFTGLGQSLEGPCGNAIVMSVYPKSKRGYIISYSTIFNTLAASLGMVLGERILDLIALLVRALHLVC